MGSTCEMCSCEQKIPLSPLRAEEDQLAGKTWIVQLAHKIPKSLYSISRGCGGRLGIEACLVTTSITFGNARKEFVGVIVGLAMVCQNKF